MQDLTAWPRDLLTAEQVESLLNGDNVTVVPGCELLDIANNVVEDISTHMVRKTGGIRWNNRTPIHGSCQISLVRSLAWGRDRIRPFVEHSRGDLSARFYLGVYVTDRPIENRAVTPMTYDVTSYDLLYLLQQTGPGDTWVAPAGQKYFDELQRAITASGVGTALYLDGDVQALEIPETRVWCLLEPGVSWLRIITELLKEIGYGPPWMEPEGSFRSRFYVDPAVRQPDWVLDVADVRKNLVGRERTVVTTTGDIANSWRFVMANAVVTPVPGSGIYTPPANMSEGPNSITALGRRVHKTMYLQAADQAALVAQGDQIVAADKASVRTINLPIARLASIMGQDDVYQLIDAGVTEKAASASWSLNFDNSLGDLVLGGEPAQPLEKVEVQAKATVTSAAPLMVRVDGADTTSFANALGDSAGAATYDVNDRVTVTIRNPVPPLVQGVES